MAARLRMAVLGICAAAATIMVAPPVSADPGPPPCDLAMAFICHFLPMAPDLEGDIDLTQQYPQDSPP